MRYLQYLLKIDYFNDGCRPREDRSDWIASLTSISGCLNGALAGHGLEINPKTSLPNEFNQDFRRILSPIIWYGLVGFSVWHNLVQGPLSFKSVGSRSLSESFENKRKIIQTGNFLKSKNSNEEIP